MQALHVMTKKKSMHPLLIVLEFIIFHHFKQYFGKVLVSMFI